MWRQHGVDRDSTSRANSIEAALASLKNSRSMLTRSILLCPSLSVYTTKLSMRTAVSICRRTGGRYSEYSRGLLCPFAFVFIPRPVGSCPNHYCERTTSNTVTDQRRSSTRGQAANPFYMVDCTLPPRPVLYLLPLKHSQCHRPARVGSAGV